MISIDSLDSISPPSKSNSPNKHDADEVDEKLDYYSVGKDIMTNVSKGPRSCRMGDIYHKIKQEVDKISKQKRTRE